MKMVVSKTKSNGSEGSTGRVGGTAGFAARRAGDFEKRNPLICLLTDFGRDESPYLVRSAIRAIKHDARIEDATHEIPAFNILVGAWRLSRVVGTSTEAEGTIYVAVVDPGVGGERKGLIVQTTDGRYLVGPDNGLLSLAFQDKSVGFDCAVSIDNPVFTLLRLARSKTFEGKDVFGPVAAHLANGVAISEFGNSVALENLDKISLACSEPKRVGSIVIHTAYLVDIDSFGNLRTTLGNAGFNALTRAYVRLSLDDKPLFAQNALIHNNFSGSPEGAILLVRSSTGYLDVARNCGSASGHLGINFGHIGLKRAFEKGVRKGSVPITGVSVEVEQQTSSGAGSYYPTMPCGNCVG